MYCKYIRTYSRDCCQGVEHVLSFLQIAVKAGLPIMLPSWVGHIWDTATLTDRVFHATDGNMVRQGEGRGTVSFEGRKDEGMGRSREGRTRMTSVCVGGA